MLFSSGIYIYTYNAAYLVSLQVPDALIERTTLKSVVIEYYHQYTRPNNKLPSTKLVRTQAANTFVALLMIG